MFRNWVVWFGISLVCVGKTYVSRLIASSMYEKGDSSYFVHRFAGRIPFTTNSLVETYKINLQKTIVESIRECPVSLFIFDDVEQLPPGILNAIVHMLDHHIIVEGVNLSKAVFIFLTNIGGTEISQLLQSTMLKNQRIREQMDLYDFESVLQFASYNSENTGFFRSHVIDTHVVDYYLPFLPLEESHVLSCIMYEFSLHNITQEQVDGAMIRSVMKHLTFNGSFVNGGCKRITKKIEAVVRKHFS